MAIRQKRRSRDRPTPAENAAIKVDRAIPADHRGDLPAAVDLGLDPLEVRQLTADPKSPKIR
jgi:hypothetical protein